MRPLSPELLQRAYSRLASEYAAMGEDSNPSKICMELPRQGEHLEVFCNVMGATLTTGHVGSKIVRVDERTGTMQAQTIVYDADGGLVANVDAAELTRARCAMMAALAVERFFGGGPDALAKLTYGIVGTGQINWWTVDFLCRTMGVPAGRISLLGSPRNRRKNADMFPAGCVWADGPGSLARCDVVIECATIRDEDEKLEVQDFQRGILPRLFVAQDSGWLLGPSFRKLAGFSDHLGQINAHPFGDYDWPWDSDPVFIRHDMRSRLFSVHRHRAPVVAYLTGIALADVVLAIEVSK